MAKKDTTKFRYEGKFVATQSFNHKTVVASGTDPLAVRDRARKKGVNSPVITYIPCGDSFNIF